MNGSPSPRAFQGAETGEARLYRKTGLVDCLVDCNVQNIACFLPFGLSAPCCERRGYPSRRLPLFLVSRVLSGGWGFNIKDENPGWQGVCMHLMTGSSRAGVSIPDLDAR